MTKEQTAEAIRNTIQPWINAVNSWTVESEKLRQTAIEGMTQSIDNTHRLAKEGLTMFNTMTDATRKHLAAQMERSVEFMTAFVP